MGRSQRLREDDARAVLDLVLDLQDNAVPVAERRRHTLKRLCDICNARVGLFVDVDGMPRRRPPRVFDVTEYGWEPAEQALFHKTIAENGIDDPLTMEAIARPETWYAMRRSELMDDEAWYGTAYVSELRRSANVDDVAGTIHRFSDLNMTVGISVHRSWDDKPFALRERTILHLFGQSLRRLYSTALTGRPTSPADRLTQRQRETLHLLLRGCSEKQVAAAMHISPHTVHTYVRQLYRVFGVNSRAELLARHVDQMSFNPAHDHADGESRQSTPVGPRTQRHG